MTKPPRAPNAGVLAMAASGGSKSSTPAEITAAERAFESAKADAEMDKLAQTLAAREAELSRRESAFREHADAIDRLTS
jgi:hypothetical protein